MYFTIGQKVLKPALTAVRTIAGVGKTQLLILKHLLLSADAHGISLRASNEETSIHYRLSAEVQAAGQALLPVHLFTDFVQDLPVAPLTLVLPSPTDPTCAQVRCRQVKANIRYGALPIEEFPRVPQVEGSQELLTVDCELLREIIEQTAFAAAADASRPVLAGIRVAFGAGQASFGAADAFRLAVRTIAVPDAQLSAEVIIPAQTLRHLARLLPLSGSLRMVLASGGKQVLFCLKEMDLAARLIAGTFPDFRSLVAAQASTRVVLPTHALVEAVHLMVPFARENQHHLRLLVQQERPGAAATLLLEAEAPDLGANEIRLDESVTVNGPELSLQVSDTYLAEALAVVPTAQVALEFTGVNRPLAVKPVGPLDAVSVIMPQVQTRPPSSEAPVQAQGTASVASAAAAR